MGFIDVEEYKLQKNNKYSRSWNALKSRSVVMATTALFTSVLPTSKQINDNLEAMFYFSYKLGAVNALKHYSHVYVN